MLFDELMQSNKMEDPEIRQSAELGRSKKKIKNHRKRHTSVSVGTFRASMFIVGTLFTIAAAAGIIWLGWKVIQIYIGG